MSVVQLAQYDQGEVCAKLETIIASIRAGERVVRHGVVVLVLDETMAVERLGAARISERLGALSYASQLLFLQTEV